MSLDPLEPRTLLSSYVYQDFSTLAGPVSADVLASGNRGPVVVVGDIDSDGTPDLLVGDAGVSGTPAVDSSGATLYSGATGNIIRDINRANPRFGWYVAALGDVDADGTPDYAIGCGIDTGAARAFVYSGLTGDLLYIFSGSGATGGATVAGIGDVNGDNHADILVGFVGDNRAVVFSGINGAPLHQYVGDAGMNVSNLGLGVAGGADFNADTVPDYIIAGHQNTHTGLVADPFEVIAYVYSGATGGLLTTFNSTQAILPGAAAVPPISMDASADFNSDGVNDIVYAAGNFVYLIDETTGNAIFTITATPDASAQSAVAIADVNADGVPDFAAGAPNHSSPTLAGAVGVIHIYSGANGSRLNTLEDSQFVSANARIGSWLAAGADLNGDGVNDLIAVGDQNPGGVAVGNGLIYAFNGLAIVPPTPDGFVVDANGQTIAWGTISGRGFIIRNNDLSLVTTLNGFTASDRIISIAPTPTGVVILGATDGTGSNPFVWTSGASFTDGTRADVTGFTEVNSPGGTYTSFFGVDANSSGMVAVYRFRVGFGPTTWLYDPTGNTLTYLFDGNPVAVNDAGHVLGQAPDTSAIFWTSGGGATNIPGFMPAGMNNSDTVIGRAMMGADPEPRPYLWNNGTFTAIPIIAGGTAFFPLSINNNGDVLGTYTTDMFTVSMFIYTASDSMTVDARAATDVGSSVNFTNATNFHTISVNDAGSILASIPGTTTSFVLVPYTNEGPFTVADSAIISSAALPDGGLFVVTTNPAGDIVAFIRSPLTSPWQRVDLSVAAGTPRLTGDTKAWYDPQENLTYIVAASTDGLLLITQLPNTTWSVRNLTTEIPGSEAIVDSLVLLQPQNGLTLVGGLAVSGDLVIYGQTLQTNGQGQVVWAYDNLYNSVFRANSLPIPDFDTAQRGRLISYETSWDGLNIVGSGTGGQPIAIWTAPGLVGWQVSNLSDATTDPDGQSGFTFLTSYITSWGGINIVSGNDLNVIWWVPQFGGEWRVDSLRAVANGPELRGETLSGYFTPWGGLNVAGLDDQNNLWVYWWTPETNQWATTSITGLFPDGSPVPTGNISTLATPQLSLNIFARSDAGDLLHYFWQPTPGTWSVTDLTVA